MTKPIQVVDLFAGPGGLGEGFNSVRRLGGSRIFKTLVSVEKEASAHRTLTLRAFYRILHESGKSMDAYFSYLKGGEHPSTIEDVRDLWIKAQQEVLRLELGGEAGNHALEEQLQNSLDRNRDWVLIGGPPCQAYSVVGRVRNLGNKDYRPEDDKRHFLYREYLDVIAKYRPAVFVMENVRGILSSRVGKKRIFGQILEDLCDPASATDPSATSGAVLREDGYTIFSLANENVYYPRVTDLFSEVIEPLKEDEYNSFVIKAEEYGIPQARHRVILVGVRNDIAWQIGPAALARQIQMTKVDRRDMVPVKEVLGCLPQLRSGLSRNDNNEDWIAAIKRVATKIAEELFQHDSPHVSAEKRKLIAQRVLEISVNLTQDLPRKHEPTIVPCFPLTKELDRWYHGLLPKGEEGHWYNHEARSHMEEDLARYLYCAVFAEISGETEGSERSPIGAKDIYLDYLAPMHMNWKSGKFADRFKVVLKSKPSKTITSHISKDGHYFIHYDPLQCRSLTVREAARLQTFPDDYYFEGNRTEQYVQVGNAVPPLLARQIAEKVFGILGQEQQQAMQA